MKRLLLIVACAVLIGPAPLIAEDTPQMFYEEQPKQNDYYCELIKEQGLKVQGAGKEEIKKLCAKWGVTL